MADAQGNGGRGRARRQTVGVLAGLALAVAAAGALVLPRLRAEAPSPLLEPSGGTLVAEKTDGVICHLNRFKYLPTKPSSTDWFHALKKSPWPEN
jgi:hypothetical protein